MATSKAEYLKKYLSKPAGNTGDYEEEKKKKKKRKREKQRPEGIQMVDDDIDMSRLGGGGAEVYSEDEEDKPQLDSAMSAAVQRMR